MSFLSLQRHICKLPYELRLLILEIGAIDDRKVAAQYARLSKAIRQIIDPILYHTVFIASFHRIEAFIAAMRLRNDPAFFATNVRVMTLASLYPYGKMLLPFLAKCLQGCPGLTQLTMTDYNGMGADDLKHGIFDKVPNLRRLHISVRNAEAARSFPKPLPMNLTHLSLGPMSPNAAVEPYEAVLRELILHREIPGLTHLAVVADRAEGFESFLRFAHSLPKSLSVFLIQMQIYGWTPAWRSDMERRIEMLGDRRVVILQTFHGLPHYRRGMQSQGILAYTAVSTYYNWSSVSSSSQDDAWDVAEKIVADRNLSR
ncbi:hypothetical protein CYLTODRAFT_489257 [Cylindrobasidium torrendii FP15055 ss-10]|uniref:F-box domain-containing protein n=1 Tax=Cylindrobasidium torrendii FP15055 ss-10 TaxID=1314674 RepID=A0A0D7BER2_9AGAR|nr:hypothetical protein CYLTODRAFT_489257 [Cylindrobasidium torrendii FP15055 ss-10]